MNDVSKIHLGRRSFTIDVEARQELKNYLAAITKKIDDQEVVDEIENRMAELLEDRGMNSDTVILSADVDYLIKQLGTPKDFEDSDDSKPATDKSYHKRLFRDTDNAIIAGVASGLANYLGIDPLIVRLVFVVLLIVTVGWGILIYIVLWLLVPEAKTSSERIQMAGKAVNVSSLKGIVEEADIKGAARRGGAAISGPINELFNLLVKLVGIVLVSVGIGLILGLITSLTYYLARSTSWAKVNIFPVGVKEDLLLYNGLVIGTLLAVFIVIVGLAIFRRKWPIKNWVTGVLVGLLLLSIATGGALTADVYPTIRDSYNANTHVSTRKLDAFSSININFKGYQNLNFETSPNYAVQFNYYKNPDLNNVKTTVKNGVLNIDTSQYNDQRNCQTICIPNNFNLVITVLSPNAEQLENEYTGAPPLPATPMFYKP